MDAEVVGRGEHLDTDDPLVGQRQAPRHDEGQLDGLDVLRLLGPLRRAERTEVEQHEAALEALRHREQLLLEHVCTGLETYDFTWNIELEPGAPGRVMLWKQHSDEYAAWSDNADTKWVLSNDVPVAADDTISGTCFWYDTVAMTGWYVDRYILVVE